MYMYVQCAEFCLRLVYSSAYRYVHINTYAINNEVISMKKIGFPKMHSV